MGGHLFTIGATAIRESVSSGSSAGREPAARRGWKKKNREGHRKGRRVVRCEKEEGMPQNYKEARG
jgi:hypothetical protein